MAAAQDVSEDTENSEAEANEIIVSGFRESLDAALDAKRESNGIIDVIVAEDIADFPDLNLAESLQRIPGVAIDRQAGEGRRITVRGLGGDFTRVRVNGLEALATAGGSDASGGTNRSRAFDFNVFASELFNELAVRKTQSAEVEEGSLGANVELRTGRPFDYGAGITGAITLQGQYNDLAEDLGPRVAGLLSYTNEEETFGALLSVAFSERLIREEGFSTVRFDDFGTFRSALGEDCSGNPTGGACEQLRNAYYARIPRYGRLDYDQQRLGITGSLQFKPGDRTTISFDGLYSDFKGDRSEEFLEVFIRGNTDNLDVTDFTINSDGVIERLVANIQPDVSNGIVPVRSEHRQDRLSTEYYQITGELDHEFNDRLSLNVLAGISRSDFAVPQQATVFFDAATAVNGYTLDFTDSFTSPQISFGDFDVTDPSSFLFTQFRNRPQGTKNTYDTLQANLEWEASDTITLKTGFSYKRFEFDTFEGRAEGNVADLTGTGPIPVDSSLANLLSGFGDGLDLGAGTDRTWVTPNFDAAVSAINLFSIPPVQRAQDTRGVVEDDYGGYLQADYNFMLGSMPLRGDVGVRYVETNVSSSGFVNGTDPVTVDRQYDDWLPSFNFVAEPGDDFLVRGGISRVMARPTLGLLNPGGSIDTFNGPPFDFNLGNPGLDPFRAWTYDLSFEWYFQPEALIALSLFQKDITSFFQQADVIETTFSQTGLPASVAANTPLGDLLAAGEDPAVEINQQVNGDDAKVRGLEIVFQTPFTFLGAGLDNFGFVGNYTYVDSDDIIGFSPNSFNATLYYEDSKFAARFTGAYRDSYLTRNPNSSGRTEGRESRGVGSTFNLDFSASYQLNDQIEFTFEAINLTDEFEFQTFDRLNLPTLYHHTGRNFLLGARYTF